MQTTVSQELNRMYKVILTLRDIGENSDWKTKDNWRRYMDLVDQLDEVHTDLFEQD
jgi:hypothetical protein